MQLFRDKKLEIYPLFLPEPVIGPPLKFGAKTELRRNKKSLPFTRGLRVVKQGACLMYLVTV